MTIEDIRIKFRPTSKSKEIRVTQLPNGHFKCQYFVIDWVRCGNEYEREWVADGEPFHVTPEGDRV